MKLNMRTPPTLGKVYLVGAGPGAADLITVRGARLLEQADIVFHDALVEPEMLELCTHAVKVPVGKRCGQLSSAQHFINKRMVDAAGQYQIIVRLKGGDPMLFGRADEEIQALKGAGIAVEVVPGITAALAAAASIGQSLTLRGVSRSVAFVTLAQAPEVTQNAHAVLPMQNPCADTLVYYMGRKDAAKIAQRLIDQNNPHTHTTPVQIMEAVSTTRERLWSSTLGQLAQGKSDSWFESNSPALIMVGQALQNTSLNLERSSSKIDNGLQDSLLLTHSQRRA